MAEKHRSVAFVREHRRGFASVAMEGDMVARRRMP